MSLSYKILFATIALLVSFAFGRYSVTTPPSVQLQETAHDDKKINEDKNTKTHSVTVTTKEPNGEIKAVTTTDSETEDQKVTAEISESQIKEQLSAVIRPRNRIDVLGSIDVNSQGNVRTTGIMLSREIVGPITLGGWVLRDDHFTYGISLGLEF